MYMCVLWTVSLIHQVDLAWINMLEFQSFVDFVDNFFRGMNDSGVNVDIFWKLKIQD